MWSWGICFSWDQNIEIGATYGRRQVLHTQARESVPEIYLFFKNENQQKTKDTWSLPLSKKINGLIVNYFNFDPTPRHDRQPQATPPWICKMYTDLISLYATHFGEIMQYYNLVSHWSWKVMFDPIFNRALGGDFQNDECVTEDYRIDYVKANVNEWITNSINSLKVQSSLTKNVWDQESCLGWKVILKHY